MSNDFLNTIVAYKKQLNEQKKNYYDTLRSNLDLSTYSRYNLFQRAISVPGQIHLIAEVKKASPSKGLIRNDFDPLVIARIYNEHKASAISVLTEDKFFLGKPEYINLISEACTIPVLTKDFIIDEGQIYEARVNGASAILLIVAILSDERLKELMSKAHDLDLDCLIEVHDDVELDRALAADAEIIGINNRNLHTFDVDMGTCERLIPRIPKGIVIVAESGIASKDDVKRVRDWGAHAILVGESLMKEQDIGSKIDSIMNI